MAVERPYYCSFASHAADPEIGLVTKSTSKPTAWELNIILNPSPPFPTIVICSESMHSKRKLEEKYPQM